MRSRSVVRPGAAARCRSAAPRRRGRAPGRTRQAYPLGTVHRPRPLTTGPAPDHRARTVNSFPRGISEPCAAREPGHSGRSWRRDVLREAGFGVVTRTARSGADCDRLTAGCRNGPARGDGRWAACRYFSGPGPVRRPGRRPCGMVRGSGGASARSRGGGTGPRSPRRWGGACGS